MRLEDEKQNPEIDHEELQYIVEKLHKFARWQRQKLAKRTGIVSKNFSV